MKRRQAILLLCVSLPICVALRIMQLIFTIDNTTGFIKKPYATTGVLISVIVCVAVAAVSLLSVTVDTVVKKNKANPIVTGSSILVGAAFFGRAIIGVLSLQNKGLGDVFIVFLAFVSAAIFVAYGLQGAMKKDLPAIVLVVPVVYYVAELIKVFIGASSLAPVTENIFIIFSTCAILLFIYEFSGFENEIAIQHADRRPKKLFAMGIAAVMLCAATTIPKTILAIAGKINMSHYDIAKVILDTAMGVFIAAYVLCNFGDKFVDKKHRSKHSA